MDSAPSSSTTSTSSTSSLLQLALGATALVSLGAVIFFAASPAPVPTAGKRSAGSEAARAEPAEVADASSLSSSPIPKAALLEIFTKITQELALNVQRIQQIEVRLAEKAAQNEQEINREALQQYLSNEFKKAMRQAELAVYASHGVTLEQVQAAHDFYKTDADFQAVLTTLQRKWSVFSGRGDAEVPERVTVELVKNVLTETMLPLTAGMEEIVRAAREQHDPATEAYMLAVQQKYVQLYADIKTAVHKKYDIDEDTLQLGILKFQNDPSFIAKMQQLSKHQQEVYSKLGM